MLGTWSPEYVRALFESDKATEPILGRFKSGEGRDGFVVMVLARRFPGMEIKPLDDRGIRIAGARADNLMQIVDLAQQCDGEIQFPGALQVWS